MGIEACTFQVRDSQEIVRGTGFAINPNLVVTCAHVVKSCKAKVGELLSLFFYSEKIELKAEVLSDGWNLEEDVAFLRLNSSLPLNATHMGERLGSLGSETEIKRSFRAFGYPNLKSDVKGFWAQGLIKGQILNNHGALQLQLDSQEITFGMSGAPVMDDESGLIVGMVQKTNIPDATWKFRDLAYALPIDVLYKLSPDKLNLNKVSHRSIHYINMAPDLEIGFIEREAEYEKLVEGLLNNQSDAVVAITTALRGAGGYGKTTLAKAICHDQKIKEKFSDGILWVTLGENPGSLISYISDLIYHLNGENRDFGTLDSATASLRYMITEKRLLLVIDDVWNSTHLEPFLHSESCCTYLISTRNDDTLPPKTSKIFVDSMMENEAIGMLRYGLPTENEEYFNKLAKRLGYWPLLLKLVNATLQYHMNELNESIAQALDFVTDGLNEEGLTAFDNENPKSRSQAVDATFAVSLKALSEDECSCYYELAIFPDDVDIPLKVLEKFWSKTSNLSSYRVKRLCTKLYSMSLLMTYDARNGLIRLHDVVGEYLRNKQKEKLPLLHSQFIDAFKIEKWENLPEEETYLWKYLSYHLVEAGRKTELRKLLFDFNWIRSKLNSTDVHFLINDYDFFHKDYSVEMVKGAIRLSANALSKDKKLLDGQLLGRLALFSENEIKSMIEDIWAHTRGIRILPLTSSLIPPGGPLLRTLEGHSSSVNAVSVTSDGKYVVSASSDNTLKVWNLKTGKGVHTLIAHYGSVNAVSVTPDGKHAISASDDSTLKVWDLNTGKEIHTLTGHSAWVNAVSVTPDGNYAVSASADETLKVWDLKTGKEVRTLTGHFRWVNAVSVTPDGNYAVSASSGKTLKVWDLNTGKEVRTLTGHSDWINAVSVTPNGNYAVSASYDSTLKVWDLKTGKEIRTLTGDPNLINAVSITPDGSYAVSASADKTLKVWDLKTGKEVRTLTGHSAWVNAVSVTPDGNYAVSASADKTLKVWDLKTGKEVRTLTDHSSPVNAISFTRDGNYAISVSYDGTVKVWNLKKLKEVHALTGYSAGINAASVTPDENYTYLDLHLLRTSSNCVNAASVTPDGNYAISVSSDNTLKLWDFKTGTEVHNLIGYSSSFNSIYFAYDEKYAVSASYDSILQMWDLRIRQEGYTLTGHFDPVRGVSMTPDRKYAISASDDGTLKIWDHRIEKEVYTLRRHSSLVIAFSITPDGKYAISASNDNTLKVWDLKTGKEINKLIIHSKLVIAVSISPDGNYAVSASYDNTLKVWDLKTGKEINKLIGHSRSIRAVSVTPDGKYVVSASSDNTLKVWDLKTGKEVRTLTGHSDWVNAVSVTSDGNYAVSASSDNTLKVWDLKTGKEINKLIGHSDWINAVSVTPDGNYAVSASVDKTLKVWDLKTGKEVRTLTGHFDWINAVSVTPDGNYAVSAYNSIFQMWDLKTGEYHTFFGDSKEVNTLSINHNESFAVLTSYNHTLKVWNIKIGKPISAFSGDSRFDCGGFSLDGTIIVAGEASGRVHFLLFERGK